MKPKRELISLTMKVDQNMKDGLAYAAEKEFTSVSSILKKAAAKYLDDNGILWRRGD
jgi:hypothetical protein